MSSRTDEPGNAAWSAALVATILLAAALRIAGLQSGLWYDEIMTLVLSVRHPLHQILTEFPGVNQHPLYSVLAHASIASFGESAWTLRLPACIFGIASVVMVYVLGVRLTTRVEAWAAAAVLATSYHHVWFSQNARGYTLLAFLTLLATHYLLRAGQTGRAADYAVYALACAAGIYTHLTMAFVVAGHVVVVLVGRAVRWRPSFQQPLAPVFWAWTGAAVLSVAAYAPFASSVLTAMNAEAPRQAAKVATASWALAEAVRSLLSGAGVFAALAGGALALIGALSLYRRQPLAFALLTLPGVVTGVAIVALHQPLRPRFFFFLSGAAAIFVGRGIGAALDALAGTRVSGRPGVRMAAVVTCTVALVAMSVPALTQNYRLPKQDFDGAIRFLDGAEGQGAQVTSAGPACLPFETYYRKSWPCLRHPDDWRAISVQPHRVLVAYTLADYFEDPALADSLRATCVPVQRFAGTLGGGDIVVCEARRQGGM
jgi:mannosyltransferase